MIAANASGPTPSTIVLRPEKRYALTRRGAAEDASLTGDLDLTGPSTVVKTKGRGGRAVIDGNGIDRIFDLPANIRLTLGRVVLRDGYARGGDGGAVRGGVIEVHDSRLVDNTADNSGGAIFNGGFTPDGKGGIIVNGGGVGIHKTLLRGNRAGGGGGGGAVAVVGDCANNLVHVAITKSRGTRNSTGSHGVGGMVYASCAVTSINANACRPQPDPGRWGCDLQRALESIPFRLHPRRQ